LWGGTYKSRAVVTLAKVVGDVASISITTTVPREELIQIAKSFGEKVTHLPAGRREEMAAAIASLKDFRHETRSSYSVSIVDGMLQRFESTETVALTEGGGSSRSLTTRSLVPVD
jgi:hypothetical protein